MTTPQRVEVTGAKVKPDDVALIIDGRDFRGWTDVRFTRGIERMPSDFTLSLTENYPNRSQFLEIKPGQGCELWAGRDRILAGHVDTVSSTIAKQSHSITVGGRNATADLVDCMAEWPGGQVRESSVLKVAQKLAEPFDITVRGESGPPVGGGARKGENILIPVFVIMIGEGAFEIIERLCRIAGLLVYDQPDGSLVLATNPAVLREGLTRNQGGMTVAASGFEEGVNVEHATTTFSMHQRYSNYKAYRFAFDAFNDISPETNLIAEFKDESVPRYRPRAVLMELNKNMALENAEKRAMWEAKRRWGRSRAVTIRTDSWRDAAGVLYTPNTLIPLHLPTLKLERLLWLASEVTYHLSERGTECEVTLMPSQAFDVQPTLPPNTLPYDIAQLQNGLGRPAPPLFLQGTSGTPSRRGTLRGPMFGQL